MPKELSIADQLAAIRAEQAAPEIESAKAAEADAARCAKLDAAKAVCVAECGEVTAALAEAAELSDRLALIELEARVHAKHKDALEAAYAEFAGPQVSNPAPVGEVTQLESHVTVRAEATA